MGKKTKENKYFISHDWFSQILGLKSGPERDLFAIVYSYNTNKDKAGNIMNFKEDAKETGDRVGASARTIIRAAESLEEKGYLINNPKQHKQKWLRCVDFENLDSMFPELEIPQELIDYSANFKTDKLSTLSNESEMEKLSTLKNVKTDKLSTLNQVRMDKLSTSICKKEKIKKCTCNKDTHIHFDNFIEQLNLIYPKTDTIRANGSNSKICKNKIYDNLVSIIGEDSIDDVNFLDDYIGATKKYIDGFQGDLKFIPAFHNLIDQDGKYFDGFKIYLKYGLDLSFGKTNRQFEPFTNKPEVKQLDWFINAKEVDPKSLMKCGIDDDVVNYIKCEYRGAYPTADRDELFFWIDKYFYPFIYAAMHMIRTNDKNEFINDFDAKLNDYIEKNGMENICALDLFLVNEYGISERILEHPRQC